MYSVDELVNELMDAEPLYEKVRFIVDYDVEGIVCSEEIDDYLINRGFFLGENSSGYLTLVKECYIGEDKFSIYIYNNHLITLSFALHPIEFGRNRFENAYNVYMRESESLFDALMRNFEQLIGELLDEDLI